MDIKKVALKQRVDKLMAQLNAASHNAAIGSVDLPNKVFDELADVFDLLVAIAFAEPEKSVKPSRKSKSTPARKKPEKVALKPKSRAKPKK